MTPTDIPVGRFVEGLQKVRHTPMQVVLLELVRVVGGHAGDESDDGFPHDNLLAISVLEGQLAYRPVVLCHRL